MGCFWSQEDEDSVLPRRTITQNYNNTIPHGHTFLRGEPISYQDEDSVLPRRTITQNSNNTIPHGHTFLPTYQARLILAHRTPSVQTQQVKHNVAVKPPRENSVEIPKYRPTGGTSKEAATKLIVVNKNYTERPKFGEYKCQECGHTWESRLCWPDKYQICKDCNKKVYPHNQRGLQAIDFAGNNKGHIKKLCEKCNELGHYCNLKDPKPKTHFQTKSGIDTYKRK